ncbi:MAG: helix-turn-helix transcriptional regulator [Bacilli bacterium]
MDDAERRQSLAEFLRTRRERLSPADVGLPPGSRRRTPGLRREEVAQLANIGTSWYVSLEQGRDIHPSHQVLESLGAALKLTAAEQSHLFLLAKAQTSSQDGQPELPEESVTPALARAIQSLNPHPAYVLGRRWDLLAWNQAAEFVFEFSDIAPPHSRNFLWRSFTHPNLLRHEHWHLRVPILVAQFRVDFARYPGDPQFKELVADLKEISENFRSAWASHDVTTIADGHKRMNPHPKFGVLEFEHVTLQVPTNADQKVVIYTCLPETAAKIEEMLTCAT